MRRIRRLPRYIKVNRIHGLRETLWRKNGMCDTLTSSLQDYTGDRAFFFPCWILPRDMATLAEDAAQLTQAGNPALYIAKPPNHGGGTGIFILQHRATMRWSRNDSLIVQRYLHVRRRPRKASGPARRGRRLNASAAGPAQNPLLINGYKFDLRTYVLVTSFAPLRVYIYNEGLTRFASLPFNKTTYGVTSRRQFLTNTSVNRKYKDINDLVWTFAKLRRHLRDSMGVDPDALFESVSRAIVQTLLAAEPQLRRHFASIAPGYDCAHCYQLLGVDVILDEFLRPRVIEVNGAPSLELTLAEGSLYDMTKLGLVDDVLRIVFKARPVARRLARELHTLDQEKIHVHGVSCNMSDNTVGSARRADGSWCLDQRDLESLLESRREAGVAGNFRRIYPSSISGAFYAPLVEHAANVYGLRRSLAYAGGRSSWRLHDLQIYLERLAAAPAAANARGQ